MTYISHSHYRLIAVTIFCAAILSACAATPGTETVATQTPVTSSVSSGDENVDRAVEQALNRALKEGDTEESLSLLEKLYNRNTANPDVAVRYARALREDEQMNRARLILTPFTRGEDPYQPALTEMAMIHLGLGQYKEAEKFSKKASALDDKDGRAFLALGTALDAQGKHEPAEEAFRKGLDEWRGDPAPILNNLALNLAAQGKVPEALKILEKARDLSPGRMEIERNYRIISTLNETVGPRIPTPQPKPQI